MRLFKLLLLTGFSTLISSCNGLGSEKPESKATIPLTSVSKQESKSSLKEVKPKPSEEPFLLTEENAIPFFFEYEKTLREKHLKFETTLGNFTVKLYDNVPYHRANAVYLAKKGYYDGTVFHRIVKGFIIQGGNADSPSIPRKRKNIGRYLLPPDTGKGHPHHRGVISMPSSDLDNPHKLASPYEFFIVVTDPGSYHLDGDYTAFGEVIQGMEVVDQINKVEVDSGDWPLQNVYIQKVTAF